MSVTQIALLVLASVLLFWAVGAYNRLVNLRNEIARAFAPIDAQLRQRDALLRQWIGGLRPVTGDTPQLPDAVEAACSQLIAACDVVRRRPAASPPMASLRLAETTLSEARARLDVECVQHAELLGTMGSAILGDEIAAVDGTLAFARRQFNDSAQRYNAAVHQFPTWLLARLFGFRGAGSF